LHHNVPGDGPVIVDAKEMSSKWRNRENIPVNGEKTVGDLLGASGNGYLQSGTCVGTYCNANVHLRLPPVVDKIAGKIKNEAKRAAKKVKRFVKRIF